MYWQSECKVVEGLFLVGQIWVLIGILEVMSWDVVKDKLEGFGVKVVGLVLVKIYCVVVGFGVGLKLVKVNELGVKVFDEDGLLKLFDEYGVVC